MRRPPRHAPAPPAPRAEAGCAASSGRLSLWTAVTLQGPQQVTSHSTAAQVRLPEQPVPRTRAWGLCLHPSRGPACGDTNKGQELLCVQSLRLVPASGLLTALQAAFLSGGSKTPSAPPNEDSPVYAAQGPEGEEATALPGYTGQPVGRGRGLGSIGLPYPSHHGPFPNMHGGCKAFRV